MTDELREKLRPFRAKAVEQGVPADEVDRWSDLARPCAMLTGGGDGPVAGRFGGPLLLPPGTPDPRSPYIGSVDFAALPPGSTDLPLPADGRLLLFAWTWDAWDCENHGQAIYVPAGTPVAERDKNAWHGGEIHEEEQQMIAAFPQGELRVSAEPSLTWESLVELPDGRYGAPPGFPNAEKLTEAWGSTWIAQPERLQIGGYSNNDMLDTIVHGAAHLSEHEGAHGQWDGSEPTSKSVADWVMLAQWIPGYNWEDVRAEGVYWGIQRADLAARRFDRTFCAVFWNP